MSDYPRGWEELTPEQQAALVEFGKRFAEGMRKLADAFNQLTTAAVEAHRQVEAARAAWDSETEWPTRPHETDPTPGDWHVTDDPVMTGKPYHDHGDDGPCGPECEPEGTNP